MILSKNIKYIQGMVNFCAPFAIKPLESFPHILQFVSSHLPAAVPTSAPHRGIFVFFHLSRKLFFLVVNDRKASLFQRAWFGIYLLQSKERTKKISSFFYAFADYFEIPTFCFSEKKRLWCLLPPLIIRMDPIARKCSSLTWYDGRTPRSITILA